MPRGWGGWCAESSCLADKSAANRLGLITFFWGTLCFTRTSPKEFQDLEFQDFQTENSRDVRRLSAMFVFVMVAMVVIIVMCTTRSEENSIKLD